MNIEIETLLAYAIDHHLMEEQDQCYARNRILALFHVDGYNASRERMSFQHVHEILDRLCDEAIQREIILDSQQARDAFDSAIMDCVMMRPSQLINAFWKTATRREATDMFYAFSKDSNYIRCDRIAKNMQYQVDSKYGIMDITINCSKPEKDPRDIERARQQQTSGYPKCVLCKENEGFYGNASRDGRSNIRLLPITLAGQPWYFQYSPYVYYNEHCIVLHGEHTPMKTCRETFVRLLEFLQLFPHYFIGANADLPIVGGSILNHDHYQGGHYTFAMANASVVEEYDCFQYLGVSMKWLYWPLSVLRLSSKSKEGLIKAADCVLKTWRGYSDERFDLVAYSDLSHNTISTIARMREELFELDLVLRNNRTSAKYPFGIFHPHHEIHHIKKENIGIIEVMGLAVLPKRLKEELQWIASEILDGDLSHHDDLKEHHAWMKSLQERFTFTKENIQQILYNDMGAIFVEGLEHCGIFPHDAQGKKGMACFIAAIKKEDVNDGNGVW